MLCILTVVCSSGCVRSCIDNYVEEREQRDLSEVIEKMQEKKAVAETYIPECTEYSLKIMPTEYFETDEERTAQGFIKHRDFFNSSGPDVAYPQYSYILYHDKIIIQVTPSGSESAYDLCEMKWPNHIASKDFFNFFEDGVILFDNKFFLVTTISALQRVIQAPALYLLDFKNERVLYCGCALEFYDFHKNGLLPSYEGQGSTDYDYKIVKNGDAENEENN